MMQMVVMLIVRRGADEEDVGDAIDQARKKQERKIELLVTMVKRRGGDDGDKRQQGKENQNRGEDS